MPSALTVRGVAIDLDGTLLDTLPDIAEAADRMLAQLARPQVGAEVVRGYVGNGIPRLVKRLLTSDPDAEPQSVAFEEALALFQRHYRATFLQRPHPFPGVVEGLELMHGQGLKLACVTNKSTPFTEPLLAAAGIRRYFDVVVSGDTLAAKKPDPLPLRHVCAHLGLAPAQLLVIGDSPNDTAAARAAGCPVVCVPYGYRGALEVQDLDCDAIVCDLIEASSLIAPFAS